MNRCNNNTLSWVSGNDVLLLCWIFERSSGPIGLDQFREFPLEATDELTVTIHSGRASQEVSAHRVEGKSNCLALEIPASTERGRYSVRIVAKLDGRTVCSFEHPVFSIVGNNAEANTTFERFCGMRSAEFSMDFQIVGGATVAGKNAYELWLESGHSGTLDDFLNQYIVEPATHESPGMMSAKDKTDWDTVKSMPVISPAYADRIFDKIFNPITD